MAVVYGGSFAPPLSEAAVAEYEKLTGSVSPEAADAMGILLRMVRKFGETPESQQPKRPHPSLRGHTQPLDTEEVKRLWDWVPWKHELDAYATVFDQLPSGPARNAAFHLLWFGYELTADREPCTSDRL